MRPRMVIVTCIIASMVVSAACSTEDDGTKIPEPTVPALPATVEEGVTPQLVEPAASPTSVTGELCQDKNTGASMIYSDALAIAESSFCTNEGRLKDGHFCNENSGTWWIDLEADMPGCNPACVISVNTSIVEVNWRCTGALPPADEESLPANDEMPESTGTPAPSAEDDWQTYINEIHHYKVSYPPEVQPLWHDEGQAVSFEGPLVDGEIWPMIFVGHGPEDFYRPPEGTAIRQWVLDVTGQPEDRLVEETEIAGLPALHLVFERSPQSYAADHYYFIKDGQMFSIVIQHTGDNQDWQLYNRFLQSFTFEGP